jgi:energy-coupling factor transporter ATP-binding protein EcfA2
MRWFRRAKEEAAPPVTLPEPELLRARLDLASALPALAGVQTLLERLAEDYARTRALAERPLRIALVGSTGAGKSTLLNALAGTVLAREGLDRPTSSEAVAYAPADADLGTLGEVVPRVVRYMAEAGSAWSGQVFVDTPDLNSVARANADAALAVLDQVDAALLVFHRGSVAEARPTDALRPFARRRALLGVVNFADQLGPEARQTLREQVARVLQAELGLGEPPPVFVVSALRARLGEPLDDDWEVLQTQLRTLADAGVATELRRRNAEALLGQIRTRVADALRATEEAQGEVRKALDAGLDTVRAPLGEDFRIRLGGAGGFLRQSVRRQAAGRLTGPIGWGLRLSGWGSGGLAGAALASQASLPAGLLVAATGAVLDEVQARGRQAAAERMVATADGVLDGFARQALAPARAVAAERGLPAEVSGLPDHPTWLSRLAGARALAWREVTGPMLDAAVQAWWHWARLLLVPLVQLPLLGLVGHVGYRVARAYWEGRWLPGGYFLNAAVLALLWTVAGTVVAALTLAGVAAGVARAGEAAFLRAVDGVNADLRTDAGRALAGPRDAARQLVAMIDT